MTYVFNSVGKPYRRGIFVNIDITVLHRAAPPFHYNVLITLQQKPIRDHLVEQWQTLIQKRP
jgi:hypothetical protein